MITGEEKKINSFESGHPWQFGGEIYGGPTLGYRAPIGQFRVQESIFFLNGGFELGKVFLRSRQDRWYSGSGEAMLELIPFWYADRPQQTITLSSPQISTAGTTQESQRSWHGVTITPLLFRWNFNHLANGSVVPYAQGGAGLLWTAHKFPPELANGTTTSRINFTPQGALGANIFTKERQSLDLSIRVVHYSNAGIGDANPGVPITLQFGVGYSWWKR